MEHYVIGKWEDLTLCRSNTIPDAYIHVSSFGNQPWLIGKRITVHEPRFGVLYSALIEGITGTWIVNQVTVDDSTEILHRLQQLGFDVHWSDEPTLTQITKDFLLNYKNLGYTDIIKLYVNWRRVVVACDASRWTPSSINIVELPNSAVILNEAKTYIGTDFSWMTTGIPISIAPLIE